MTPLHNRPTLGLKRPAGDVELSRFQRPDPQGALRDERAWRELSDRRAAPSWAVGMTAVVLGVGALLGLAGMAGGGGDGPPDVAPVPVASGDLLAEEELLVHEGHNEGRDPADVLAERLLAGTPAVMPMTHTVEPGDTLSGIASRYGVSVRSLAERNALASSGLAAGRILVLPDPTEAVLLTPADAVAEQRLVDALEHAAEVTGLDVDLLAGVAWAESRWRQRLVSSAGAIGIMQVRPIAVAELRRTGGTDLDVYDLEDNAELGARYLALRLERRNGDLRAALVDYHQGASSAVEHGPFPSSTRYVEAIEGFRQEFAALGLR